MPKSYAHWKSLPEQSTELQDTCGYSPHNFSDSFLSKHKKSQRDTNYSRLNLNSREGN